MRHPRTNHLVAAAVATATLMLLPRPAAALFGVGDIVLDPEALAKNTAKVASMLQELAEMQRQLESLKKQIQDLGTLLDDPGGDAVERAGQALDELTRLDATLSDWTSRLPIELEPGDVARGELPARQAEIRGYLRERVASLDTALGQLEDQRRETMGQVAAVVAASNEAPGEKAAQQATNQLHAIVAAEHARLETLRAMRHRLEADVQAARQASRAAVEADLDRDRQEAQALLNP